MCKRKQIKHFFFLSERAIWKYFSYSTKCYCVHYFVWPSPQNVAMSLRHKEITNDHSTALILLRWTSSEMYCYRAVLRNTWRHCQTRTNSDDGLSGNLFSREDETRFDWMSSLLGSSNNAWLKHFRSKLFIVSYSQRTGRKWVGVQTMLW